MGSVAQIFGQTSCSNAFYEAPWYLPGEPKFRSIRNLELRFHLSLWTLLDQVQGWYGRTGAKKACVIVPAGTKRPDASHSTYSSLLVSSRMGSYSSVTTGAK